MQTYLCPMPKSHFLGVTGVYTGVPLSGGKLYTAVAGTVAGPAQASPKASYTDITGATPNANPVVLDSQGMANIWLNGYYSMALYDANGVLQYSQDNVFSGSAIPPGVVIKTSNYSMGANDINQIIEFNSSSNVSFVLQDPSNVANGSLLRIKNVGTGNLSISGKINSSITNPFLFLQNDEVFLFSDQAIWRGAPITSKQYPPNGLLSNSTIYPTVTANQLIVTITSNIPGTPWLAASPANPVWVRIWNQVYPIINPIIVTVANNANAFASQSGEIINQEFELFVYVGYVAAQANIVQGLSRYPAGRRYADFSASLTNTKYIALSNSTGIVADDVFECVGRIRVASNATTWAANNSLQAIRQNETREGEAMVWAPTITGFSVVTSNQGWYQVRGIGAGRMGVYANISGTSNANTFFFTLPFAPLRNATVPAMIADNGAIQPGYISLIAANANAQVFPANGGLFTASGTKAVYSLNSIDTEI